MKKNIRLGLITSIALAILLAVQPAQADIPLIIDYPGYVASNNIAFNGTGYFRFAFVDSTGTTSYWSNDGTSSGGSEPAAAIEATVTNGVFNVPLGDTTINNMTAIATSVFTSRSSIYIRIWFDDGINGSQLLSPDKQLVAISYTYKAASADYLGSSSPPAGNLVGTTDSQTLTNKTFSSPSLTTPTTGGSWTLNSDLSLDSNTLFIERDTNYIGIGTSNPNDALDINGNLNMSGGDIKTDKWQSSDTNTFIGVGVAGLGTLEAAGLYNTFFGYYAGRQVTSANSCVGLGYRTLVMLQNGTCNTAIGYGALDATAAEGYCTAVGHNALGAHTTGDYATAVGYGALDANTTGNNNTAFGYAALGTNSNGDNNTAVGYNALAANTTSTQNTAMGSGTLAANTIGIGNTALGYNALGANTIGDYNVAVGRSALLVNTGEGNGNVAVGDLSLDANTSGDYNVAIGVGALGGNSEGVDNTGLGHFAGDNITTGSSNIIIGASIDAPSATGSYQLNIGNTLYGQLDEDAAGDDNIGINTSTFETDASGVLAIANGTAPGAGTADQCYFYAKGTSPNSEMYVMDEAGNETLLSPHDQQTGKWIFRSKNVNTGEVLRMEMEELIFDLAQEMSQKTGKQYIEEYYE